MTPALLVGISPKAFRQPRGLRRRRSRCSTGRTFPRRRIGTRARLPRGGSHKPSHNPRRVRISRDGPPSAGDLLHRLGFEFMISFQNARRTRNRNCCLLGALSIGARASSLRATPYRTDAGRERALIGAGLDTLPIRSKIGDALSRNIARRSPGTYL